MSDNTPKLYIAGMGMITPVGANVAMTAASVEAGISAYGESRYCDQNARNRC
jgi:3-oxoacyl-[acyl-carrier-protein] synthase I